MYKFLKLAPNITKRYELKLNRYFFYNNVNKKCYDTDNITGTIISAFDGTISTDEIIDVIVSNNPDVTKEELKIQICDVVEFLKAEGVIYEYDR